MAEVLVGKSAEDLRREIDELHRQQREITERLRDPRGLRKAGGPGAGIRGPGAGIRGPGAGPQRLLGRGPAQRGAIRRGDAIDAEEQPPTKKRLLSAVVKVEGHEDAVEPEEPEIPESQEEKEKDGEDAEEPLEPRKPFLQRAYGRDGGRRDFRGGDRTLPEQENENIEPLPRVMPKIDDPNVAKRNRRMFGALLGTLEKFRQEDKKLSGSEAFMRRSTSQKRAEQRAQEESEKLRQQERAQLAEKRRRDLILRARLAAKAEEKQLEVVFIQWTEHQAKLSTFLRTKAEPGIFYMPCKPSEETDKLLESRKEDLTEWKNRRRAELTEYQRQSTDEHLAKVEVDIERWQASAAQQGSGHNTVEGSGDQVAGNVDGSGCDDEGDGEKHSWRRGRVSRPSDNGEDEHVEDVVDDVGKLEDTDVDVKDASLETEGKGSDEGENLDTKDMIAGGALKDVMDYGSGEDDAEDR